MKKLRKYALAALFFFAGGYFGVPYLATPQGASTAAQVVDGAIAELLNEDQEGLNDGQGRDQQADGTP